jgi:CRISPR-associated endonuclease/helicase Cas3
MQNVNLFFAKADTNRSPTLPLINHLLDVYSATKHLWEILLPQKLKEIITEDFDLNIESTGEIIAFIAGLHDIGKATEYFQDNVIGQSKQIKFSINHSLASSIYLSHREEIIYKVLAKYLSMHHGQIYSSIQIYSSSIDSPDASRLNSIYDAYYNYFDIDISKIKIKNENPTWSIVFVGLLTFSDWLVSQESHWININSIYSSKDESIINVHKTIENAKIFPGNSIDDKKENIFNHFFNSNNIIFTPRPLQELVNCYKINTDAQSLTFIEAPTGEGKTEAAFLLAGKQMLSKISGGIFLAMPTQATSNMQYVRFNSFLENACTNQIISSNLIHANSRTNEHFNKVSNLDRFINQEENQFYVSDWFVNKKLALISQFGVGTVDQALLSVLNVKHFFLRLFGLAGKTIIFDEVHSYDICMAEIMKNLLRWLKALGSSVIILSATLHEKMKNEFIESWGADVRPLSSQYPLISQIANSSICEETFEVNIENRNKKINIEFSPNADDLVKIADSIIENSVYGCRIAVILNTVCRTQELYSILKARNFDSKFNIILFHSRFMLKDRQNIENQVISTFGKYAGNSDKINIVIATQVIEQSLDLDFDLMYSDFAPIDLLLQRAGRIHRHNIEIRKFRPETLLEPKLILLVPETKDKELPDFKANSAIYENIYLWRTYYKLKDIAVWDFADSSIYRDFVESVYADRDEEDFILEIDEIKRKDIADAKNKMEIEIGIYQKYVRKTIINSPKSFKKIFRPETSFIANEESTTKKGLVAHTRCSDTISRKYILLFKKDSELFFSTNDIDKVNYNNIKSQMQFYLDNSISVYYKIDDDITIAYAEENPDYFNEMEKYLPDYNVIIFDLENSVSSKYEYNSKYGLNKKNDAK